VARKITRRIVTTIAPITPHLTLPYSSNIEISFTYTEFLKHICKAAVLSRPDTVPTLKAPQLLFSLEVVKELF